MERGPLTRRQKTLASKRDANEQASVLLQLSEDVLSHVLGFLEAKDLAVLETVCTHFRFGSWLAGNKAVALTETSAKRKLDVMEIRTMPPGFRCGFVGKDGEPPVENSVSFGFSFSPETFCVGRCRSVA